MHGATLGSGHELSKEDLDGNSLMSSRHQEEMDRIRMDMA